MSRRDRMRAKLREVKEGLRQRWHLPIPETGKWLGQIVAPRYRSKTLCIMNALTLILKSSARSAVDTCFRGPRGGRECHSDHEGMPTQKLPFSGCMLLADEAFGAGHHS